MSRVWWRLRQVEAEEEEGSEGEIFSIVKEMLLEMYTVFILLVVIVFIHEEVDVFRLFFILLLISLLEGIGIVALV